MKFLKLIFITLTILFTTLNVSAINCDAYTEWTSGSQSPNAFRTYGGSLYQNNSGANGWDGAGDNPSVNPDWTLIGVCDNSPTATTQTSTSVTSTTMTLNGTVTSDNGLAITDRGFIYGTDMSDVTNSELGSLLGDVTSISEGGTTVSTYNQTITDLCVGKTYYIKSYATNSDGTGYGSSVTTSTTIPGTYTTTQDGAFSNPSTWGDCGVPPLNIGNTIVIEHDITSSGITLTQGTDIVINSGASITNTGNISFGGDDNPSLTNNGTLTTTNITYTSLGTLTNNDTLIITNDLSLSNNGVAILGGYTTVGGDATNNAPGEFRVTSSGTLEVSGNLETSSDGLFNAEGDVTILTDWKVFGSGGSTVDGTVTTSGTMTVSSNGYIIGTGVIEYGAKNINPDNSGAYVGCIDGSKWDDNAGTPTWGEIDNPWDLTNCAALLPVELVFFTNKYDTYLNTNTFSWITASEINNDYFELLVSKDLNEWRIETTILGKGNSSTSTLYEYEMYKPNKYKYAKLRQTDYDGTQTYSHIIPIKSKEEIDYLQVEVNMGNTITIDNDYTDSIPVKLYDMNGKKLYESIINKGITTINIKEVTNHYKGMVIIRVGNINKKTFTY